MSTPVIIALGANLDDRLQALRRAVQLIRPVLNNIKGSSVYTSEPMYEADQPDFVNAVIVGTTHLGPVELFFALKSVEQAMGRQVRARNGPREIDLDLIAYGALSYEFMFASGDSLIIPHPRISERRFVIEPIAEVGPDWSIPKILPIKSLLASDSVSSQRLSVCADANFLLSN